MTFLDSSSSHPEEPELSTSFSNAFGKPGVATRLFSVVLLILHSKTFYERA